MPTTTGLLHGNMARRALAVSVLAHIAFAGLITLTFPIEPARKRPFFVFLGSLLEPQELSPYSLAREASALSLDASAPMIKDNSHFNPVGLTTVTKPSFPAEVRDGDKEYIKIDFLDKPNEDIDLYKEFKIDAHLPKIIPLQLHRK